MHLTSLEHWRHAHTFGTDTPAAAERRTRWVIGLTFVMMVVEIAAGIAFGSMALLADGWHMATHAAALSITAFAYSYARRHSGSARYSFGTGKVGALGGFGSAVALAVAAVVVFAESAFRFLSPVAIRFNEAIGVAVVGLAINLLSAFLLSEEEEQPTAAHLHQDHNLRAAYLHVLADALTSVFAVVALTAGKLLDWTWMDPAMGIVGSIIIARWSYGLLRNTSRVLLDAEVDEVDRDAVKKLIESKSDNRVADLHLWRVGPRHLAAIVCVVTHDPREPSHYRALLRERGDIVDVTIEVHRCAGEECAAA